MNQVTMRRIALSAASVSLGCLMAVVLLCSICTMMPCYAEAGALCSVSIPTEGIPISCTPLVVEAVASYDGAFYEDGTGREVMNVAAIMLRNCSDVTVPYASAVVYTANCRYEFEATMLPANAAVLIPERNATVLTEREVVRCFGWITVSYVSIPENITVSAGESITVENLGKSPVENLQIFHRTYLSEGDFYLGGRAYVTVVPYIAAGEAVAFLPENYAPGYSRIVWYALN